VCAVTLMTWNTAISAATVLLDTTTISFSASGGRILLLPLNAEKHYSIT
jgi:hypothetical protein